MKPAPELLEKIYKKWLNSELTTGQDDQLCYIIIQIRLLYKKVFDENE